MIIPVSNTILSNFKLINSEYLVENQFYDLLPGQQEYQLYSYLTTFFNDVTILDIGTFNGRSAIALSHNPTNKVISYDIVDMIKNPEHIIYTKPNIEFRIKNVLDDLNEELVSKVRIVSIDIDHLEIIESQIIRRLEELQFSGIILLDDIHHPNPIMNDCMQRLWNQISHPKIDITPLAHWSGTGVVLMNTDVSLDVQTNS